MISRSRLSRRCASASIAPWASVSVVCAAGHSERDRRQPLAVACRPCGAVVEPDPVPQQQLGEPMPAAHQVHPHRIPRADQVTQRLLLIARNPDRMQLAGQQQPDEMLGVTRRSVLTLSPLARGILEGAATTHSTPRLASSRASPYPVGPASYAARTGRGSPAQNAVAFAFSPLIANDLQLSRLSIKHRRDDLRRVHIQTDETSSLRHGRLLLCGCGPPRGWSRAA